MRGRLSVYVLALYFEQRLDSYYPWLLSLVGDGHLWARCGVCTGQEQTDAGRRAGPTTGGEHLREHRYRVRCRGEGMWWVVKSPLSNILSSCRAAGRC